METKISVMRQFGTEQFSMTISYDKVPSQEEVKAGVATLGCGISEAFNKVNERESVEKAILTEMSEQRTAESKKLQDALIKEMKQATASKITVRDAESLNRRNKK